MVVCVAQNKTSMIDVPPQVQTYSVKGPSDWEITHHARGAVPRGEKLVTFDYSA